MSAEIPEYFETKKFDAGDMYTCRISHVYDPSKFYVVLLHKELSLFQSFLVDFYVLNKNEYLLTPSEIKRHSKCVAFVNTGFYRAEIVDIPLFGKETKKVVVFLFDYGFVVPVVFKNLFYLHEKFYNIPKFAVRASLVGIKPLNTFMWQSEAVRKFDEMLFDEIAICSIRAVDVTKKTLYINIFKREENGSKDVSQLLIDQRIAIPCEMENTYEGEKSSVLVPKVKYPHLFPSFQAIETGKMPSNVDDLEDLTRSTACISFLKPYFKLLHD